MAKKKDNFEVIRKAITALITQYKGGVCFVGSFCTFNKYGEVVDDKAFAYGTKDCIKISLKGLNEEVEKEKDEFINW